MNRLAFLFAACLALLAGPAQAQNPDLARWERQARNVTIVRDDWGIPHVFGRTDADAVFGMMYAQAEDDFNRMETNYLTSLGRLAEAEGEARLWQDLRSALFVDPDSLRALYRSEPGVAEAADERLGRRPQLLPRPASRRAAPRAHAVRAVDGARRSPRAASAATSNG